jgi:hypothetical protein
MTDSVASQVETFLNQQVRENARQFEVINTGTSSYSPLIYYILTRYYLIDYQPDLLVINVDMTDNFDDWKYRQSLVTNTAGEPWAVLPSNILKRKFIETNRGLVAANVLMKTIVLLEQYSYTFNWLRKLLYHPDLNESGIPQPEKTEEKPTTSEFYQHWAWCKHKWDSATQGHVDFTLQMLGLLIDFCKHHDIRVMITAVPHYEQFTKDKQGEFIWSHKPFEAIRNLADEKDVVYLDSYAALAPKIQGSRQTEFYYFNDMHFNPKGNDLWAKAHIRAFIDHGDQLLPRDSH